MEFDGGRQGTAESEFLAVILAGFGNDLRPLTCNYGDEVCPKALLPIANRPLLEYVLSWVEQSGIKDVLLLCPETHHSALYHHINSEISSPLRVDLQSFPESQDAEVGTCALLRHLSPRITKDFVLLSCDFIAPSSFHLQTMLDRFRADIISDSTVMTTCWFPSPRSEKAQYPEEWGRTFPCVSVLCDSREETLLYVDTSESAELDGENFSFKTSMLIKHPRNKLLAGYQDSHIYVCQRTILDLVCSKPQYLSFREEFLPWLCKMQYHPSKGRISRQGQQSPLTAPQNLALEHSTHRPGLSISPSIDYVTRSRGLSHYPEAEVLDENQVSEQPQTLRVGIVLLGTGAIRVNSIAMLFEINGRLLSSVAYVLPSDHKDRSLIDLKAQVSTDSIIGSSTQVSERAMIKKSTIGRHCKIGKQARIINCILFDHCVVGEGAKLDGCILGKNTKIGAMSEMTRCLTQAGYEVGHGETFKGEKLEILDWASLATFNS